MVNPNAVEAMIRQERSRLAGWLADVPEETWSAATLCDGWRVCDVVGHVTFPWRVPTLRLLGQMARHRGFDRASAVGAVGLGSIGRDPLIVEIREHVDDYSRPPGATLEDLLAEVVIHPADIAIPNDGTWESDPAAVLHLLDYMTTTKKGAHYHPEGGIDGLRFVASDPAWSWGGGAEVTGSGADVLLAITGRDVVDRLAGPGVAMLAERIG